MQVGVRCIRALGEANAALEKIGYRETGLNLLAERLK